MLFAVVKDFDVIEQARAGSRASFVNLLMNRQRIFTSSLAVPCDFPKDAKVERQAGRQSMSINRQSERLLAQVSPSIHDFERGWFAIQVFRHLVFTLTLFAVGLFSALAQASDLKRPNVLIILTDDQGLGDFSRHGNPVLRTPHLDRLASESVRLTDFHSAPMCTPTRGQLMTGLDAVRNGATSVTGGRSFLRRGIPTMPELLAKVGYRTGLSGKWHLGDHFPHRPMDRGFQKAIWHQGWGFTAAPEFSNTLFDGHCFDGDRRSHFSGHCTDWWFDSAINWMQDCHAKQEPFFCYLPLNAPHAPHEVAENIADHTRIVVRTGSLA